MALRPGVGLWSRDRNLSARAHDEHRCHGNPLEDALEPGPPRQMKLFLLLLAVIVLNCTGFFCPAGAVTTLIPHPVPLRQKDKDPCVCQGKPSAPQPHSCLLGTGVLL